MEKLTMERLVKYREKFIPTGKARGSTRDVTAGMEVEYISVSSDEAPVAFICKDNHLMRSMTIRAYGGKLYRQSSRQDGTGRQRSIGIEDVRRNWIVNLLNEYSNLLQVQKDVRKSTEKQLFIDGQLWERCREPKYLVCQDSSAATRPIRIVESVTKNVRGMYFSATEGEKARREARRIALERRNLDALARININIEVKMSDRVKFRERA